MGWVLYTTTYSMTSACILGNNCMRFGKLLARFAAHLSVYGLTDLGLSVCVMPDGGWVRLGTGVSDHCGPKHLGKTLRCHLVLLAISCHTGGRDKRYAYICAGMKKLEI